MTVTITTVRTIDVETIPVIDSRFLYKQIDTTTSSLKSHKPTNTTRQGICTKAQLSKLRNGHAIKDSMYFVISDEAREQIVKLGYSGIAQSDFKYLDRRDVYDFVKDGGDINNVICFEGYDHSFWDVNGDLIATGKHFDYIGANMHDRCYDLAKAVEILEGRSDITWTKPQEDRYGADTDSHIQRVPYYNQDCASQFLEFFWTPSQEQAVRLWETKGSFETYKLIFDNDWLGLRAGGAALFNDFYKSKERAYSEDDDDED